jgi:hypothetical protein
MPGTSATEARRLQRVRRIRLGPAPPHVCQPPAPCYPRGLANDTGDIRAEHASGRYSARASVVDISMVEGNVRHVDHHLVWTWDRRADLRHSHRHVRRRIGHEGSHRHETSSDWDRSSRLALRGDASQAERRFRTSPMN